MTFFSHNRGSKLTIRKSEKNQYLVSKLIKRDVMLSVYVRQSSADDNSNAVVD